MWPDDFSQKYSLATTPHHTLQVSNTHTTSFHSPATPPNKPTIHHIPTPHPHTPAHPTTHTPWFLLLTILLVNFVFYMHSIKFNFQSTTPPFHYLYEILYATFVLATPSEPDHDTLVILNTMTSTHSYFALSSTFSTCSITLLTTYSTTTPPLPPPPLQLTAPPDTPHRPHQTALKQTPKNTTKKEDGPNLGHHRNKETRKTLPN